MKHEVMTTENLLGDLPEMETARSPKQILFEQASVLSDSTKNLLEGSVRVVKNSNLVACKLVITVPSLDNYQHDVLSVVHDPVMVYPARVFDLAMSRESIAQDEKELLSMLESILQGDTTRRVISALLRQAHDTIESPPF